MQRAQSSLSTFGGICAILLWSATFAFARSLSERVGGLSAGAAVYLLGGLFGLCRLAWGRRGWESICKLPRLYLLGCGGLFVFYTVAIYVAVGSAENREQLVEVALVNYLWPALTVILSVVLLRKRASFWLVPGTLLALTGIFLVMTQGTQLSWASLRSHLASNPTAYALVFLAAIAWGLYSNLTRRWAGIEGGGAVDLFVLASGLVLLVLSLPTNRPSGWGPRAIGEALALALVTTVSYILWETAMRRGNLLLVAAASYLTPLFSTLVSCLYLNVTPGPKVWFGCVVLVCGSVMSWRSVTEPEAGQLAPPLSDSR